MRLRIFAGFTAYLMFLFGGAALIGNNYWQSFLEGLTISLLIFIFLGLLLCAAGAFHD